MSDSTCDRLPQAGDFVAEEYTETLYLSPKPLPTGSAAFNGRKMHREVNDVFLDFDHDNGGLEYFIRLTFGAAALMPLVFLVLGVAMGVNDYIVYGSSVFKHLIALFWQNYPLLGLVVFYILFLGGPLCKGIYKTSSRSPIRFNRQRREVAYVPKKGKPPIIVSWEEVIACVKASIVSNQQTFTLEFSLMIGMRDARSEEVVWVPLSIDNPSLAIGEWETLRVYMEIGPEAVPTAFLSDEEFQEGTVAYFHMCRGVYRDMHSWPVYAFGFLIVQFCSGWTLPCRITQWVNTRPKAAFPESIREWSKPLPIEQHTQPSAELGHESAKINEAFSQGQSWKEYYNIKFSEPEPTGENNG